MDELPSYYYKYNNNNKNNNNNNNIYNRINTVFDQDFLANILLYRIYNNNKCFLNSLTTEKQTTKFSSANFQKFQIQAIPY